MTLKNHDAIYDILKALPDGAEYTFKFFDNQGNLESIEEESDFETMLSFSHDTISIHRTFQVFDANSTLKLHVTGSEIVYPKIARAVRHSEACSTFVYVDVYEKITKTKLFRYLRKENVNLNPIAISTLIPGMWCPNEFDNAEEVVLCIANSIGFVEEINVLINHDDGTREFLFRVVGDKIENIFDDPEVNWESNSVWSEDNFDFVVNESKNQVSVDKPTVIHLMRLASRFRQADASTGYDVAYKNLQDEIYAAIDCARKGIEFKPSVEL